jgi:hypothetical protein
MPDPNGPTIQILNWFANGLELFGQNGGQPFQFQTF